MIINVEQLKKILKTIDKKIVTTNGAFDLFHAGHLRSLKFAKEQGDILIVGINSDESIKRYKSKDRPIVPEDERAEIVSAINYVDYVVIFHEKTPITLLELIKPHIHVKGSEYTENIPEKAVVEKYGGKVVFLKRDENEASSTKIINKILRLAQYGS